MADKKVDQGASVEQTLPVTDYAEFEKDAKAKIEEILDEMDVRSELRSRKEILRSIKKQQGEMAMMELQMMQLAQLAIFTGICFVGSKLVNTYFCNHF